MGELASSKLQTESLLKELKPLTPTFIWVAFFENSSNVVCLTEEEAKACYPSIRKSYNKYILDNAPLTS